MVVLCLPFVLPKSVQQPNCFLVLSYSHSGVPEESQVLARQTFGEVFRGPVLSVGPGQLIRRGHHQRPAPARVLAEGLSLDAHERRAFVVRKRECQQHEGLGLPSRDAVHVGLAKQPFFAEDVIR